MLERGGGVARFEDRAWEYGPRWANGASGNGHARLFGARMICSGHGVYSEDAVQERANVQSMRGLLLSRKRQGRVGVRGALGERRIGERACASARRMIRSGHGVCSEDAVQMCNRCKRKMVLQENG